MRKASYAALVMAVFSLFCLGCDLLNFPVKDYIRNATGRAEGLDYEFLTDYYMMANGAAAIPPADVSERTLINVFLSNEQNYDLLITIEGPGSEYARFALSGDKQTILVTLLNQPRAADSVYVFDLTLNMTANNRPMPSIKLPRMECRYLDSTLAGLSVSPSPSADDVEFLPPFNPDTTAYWVILPHKTEAIVLSGILHRFGTCLIQNTLKSWADGVPEFTHVIAVQDGELSTVPITVTADSGKTSVYTLQIAWPGMITDPYSLILRVEDIIDAAAEESFPDITIARSGAGQTYTVLVTGEYDSILWEVAGVGAGKTVTGTGNQFILDGSNVNYNTLGGHVLKLIVVKDGKTYQVNIPFTVVAKIINVFNSVDAFRTWLADQPPTTADEPYFVKLNVNDLGGDYNTPGSVGNTLRYNVNRYVNLDLSDSDITSIDDYAFYMCSLTSITIPDSVESIGDSAFFNCDRLTNVTIGNHVNSIGYRAFAGCENLTSITIPASVTSIGNIAFQCYSLTTINVESSNTAYSSNNGVLYNKDKTTLILYPQGKTGAVFTIPNNVTSIGDYAFQGCVNLTSITIPTGVTSIGYYAFRSCYNLTSVIFQGTITAGNFENNAFSLLGDLRAKYYATDAANGTPGTYITTNPGDSAVWTKVD